MINEVGEKVANVCVFLMLLMQLLQECTPSDKFDIKLLKININSFSKVCVVLFLV